jgi:hypothetical protein
MSNGLGFGFGLISSSNIAGDSVSEDLRYYRSAVLADNPLFYYRLGESSGTTAYDEVAASSNGTYYNTPTLGQTGAVSGDSDTTVLFEQANYENAETLTLSSETSLLPCTIECFIKPSGASDSYAGIVFYRSGSNSASGLNIRGTDLGKLGYHWRGQSNTFGYSGGPTLSDNTWYYVALVVESTKATFYVIEEDGTLTTAVNTVSHSALDCSNDGWYIARDSGYTRYFQGYIDEVALYDQALSQSTLVAHAAAAGFATVVPNVITSANSSNTTTTIDCSSVTEGYLMIILVTLWATRSITSYPSSWNLEITGTEGTSSGQSKLYAFSKIAAATETTYDFTVNNTLYGDRFSYSLLEIPKTGLGVRNAAYSSDGVLGSIYSYSTDTLHLALCGKADSAATEDVIHPSGYTEIVDRTGSLHNHAIAYKEISGASRALSNGTDAFTDPDNTGATGDNNLSTIHLAISDAGSIISENFEGTGTPVGFTNVIAGSGTISFDETTEVLEGSESLKVYSDSDTYTYVDLNHEYDHIVAIFGYKTDSMSNRKDVHFLDDELSFHSNECLTFGSVSSYTKGISHSYNSILLTLTGTVNDFHYVRVEIDRSGGVVKIARSNDKTFPTSGTNYAEDTSASFNSNFSGTRYIAFGARSTTRNSWYDDLEVTGEI